MSEFTKVTVSELLKLSFSRLTNEEKAALKKRGRCTPELKFAVEGHSHGKSYKRGFSTNWYEKKDWLCGCEDRNALFCFPCLIFGGETSWAKTGFRNIARLKDKLQKHEQSKAHMDNLVSYAMIGTSPMTRYLSNAYRDSIQAHNANVTKNREVLSHITETVF